MKQVVETGRKFYRIDEVATLTGVSRDTVKRWLADGTLTGRKTRGAVLITATAVDAIGEPIQPKAVSIETNREVQTRDGQI